MDVIAAIATAVQPSAIGILRLSGDGCAELAGKVCRLKSGRPLSEAPNRTQCLAQLLDRQGRVIDEILAVYTRAPATYTGEDTVELHCHGAPAVLASGLESLFAAGARQAGPGEFTKRAFLHGRMDLTQAEAVVDLIDAESAEAAANAAGQVGGALVRKIDPLYRAMTDLCSHFHAVLDYPDEDIPPFRLEEFSDVLQTTSGALWCLHESFARGQFLRKGVRAVILGRPNVGKSSLLNALAGFERVIVTEIPGTTRDTVEQTVRVGRVLLRLSDTAGIRDTDDRIEAMGVQRSVAAAREAELALFVCDGSQALTAEDLQAIAAAKEAPCAIGLINKSDLPQCVRPEELPFDTVQTICAKDGGGLAALTEIIESRFGPQGHTDGSILTNARQAGAVERAAKAIDAARASLCAGLTPDAVLLDVEAAMAALGELTGRTIREDITNRIFERFCVGK